jgi:hypothetical protein
MGRLVLHVFLFLGYVAQFFQQANFIVHSSLAFCRFILGGFANSRLHPHNQSISLKPFKNPSMDRSIKNVSQLKLLFKPYCLMFKEIRGEAAAPDHTVPEKKN